MSLFRKTLFCEIAVPNLHKNLTSNLRILRLYEGLTQEQVSCIANVSRSTYNRIEQGKSTPDLPTLCLLATYYRIEIDLLVGTDLFENYRKK